MWLNSSDFEKVVASAPLVSIDLIIINGSEEILLGQRINRPAKGYWFVPGGRIMKNESLDTAFKRISKNELGHDFDRRQARLLGVYEHFYEDSVFGPASVAPETHYVVLGYLLMLPRNSDLNFPQDQHNAFCWWNCSDMRNSDDVHSNTLAYLDALP